MPPKRKSAFFSATQEAQKDTPEEFTVKPSGGETAVPTNSEAISTRQDETLSITVLPSRSVTVEPSQSETVAQHQRNEVKPLHSTTAKKEVKVSFYLTPEQAEKLDDLAYEHKKRTGKRINRNDIVRHFVDHCRIEDLHDIE